MATIKFNAEEIREALEDEILEIVRDDARAVVTTVILATPVGNPALWQRPAPANYEPGHGRLNWQVSIGAEATNEIPGQDPSGQRAIAQAFGRIAGWNSLRDSAFFQNNVPYMGRLNDGHSTQAPAGFIEKAVAVGQRRGDQSTQELP